MSSFSSFLLAEYSCFPEKNSINTPRNDILCSISRFFLFQIENFFNLGLTKDEYRSVIYTIKRINIKEALL